MAKYEIEMSEAAVRVLIHDLREDLGDAAAKHVADILEAQIPVPAPDKVWAVVRVTESNYVYVRTHTDTASDYPWIDVVDGEARSTERLGRVFEVLSPGVDL